MAEEQPLHEMDRRIVGGLVCSLVVGCATHHATLISRTCLLTEKPILPKQSVAAQLVKTTVLSPLKVLSRPAPSSNLANGQIPDSSFFTNRRIASMSLDEIRRGPTQPGWVATPPFTVTKLKDEGKTAGFFVKDAAGARYLFKLDHASYPELLTGAEPVASKLIYALGYYVPSYEVVNVPIESLRVAEGGPVSHEALQAVLAGRVKDGHLRVCASRLIDGEILGPFRFQDYRQLTELRALRLAYAWINNTDAKDHNTLMAWTGDRAIGYLIDFGTSFGADAKRGPKRPCQGWLNDVDLKNITLEVVTLSLHRSACDVPAHLDSPPVGLFTAKLEPEEWKPYAPNLAFDAMTKADAQWMARRLAQFSRAQLETAVAAGRYSDPRDAGRVLDVLDARRNEIVREYLPQPRILAQPAFEPSAATAPAALTPMPAPGRRSVQ